MKVFCVGLSNTGTTSLTVALRTLGFDAVHWHVTTSRFAIGRLDAFSARLHRELYGIERCEREGCLAGFKAHASAVRAHFADRPGRLLELDIKAGDAWAPLCGFLSLPVPELRFPRDIDPTDLQEGVGYRFARMPRRLLRRLRAAVH